MRFTMYVRRILYDKVKLFFVILLLLIPLLDIGQMLYDLHLSAQMPVPDPRYVSFSALYTGGTNHLLHRVMFWFLPIYLLIIAGEDSLEDYDTGYRLVMQSRVGRRRYFLGKAGNSFLFSFLLMLVSLLLNYGLIQMIFAEGKYIWIEENLYPEAEHRLYTLGYDHPVFVNLAVIFMSALFAGLISMVGNCLAQSFHDRKIVYGITFMLWFVFILLDDGMMSILHPFTNMIFGRWLIGFLFIASGYGFIAAASLAMEVRSGAAD